MAQKRRNLGNIDTKTTSRRSFLKGSLGAAGAALLGFPAKSWAAQPGRVLADGFVGPWGVSYSANGELFVSDPGSYRVYVFDQEGNLLRQFGKPGSGDGQLNYPTGLHVCGPEVFVCDTNNGRIAVFGADGAWHGSFGGLGIATAKLAAPNGVWGGDRWIWVANTRGHVLQRYSWTNRKIDAAFGYLGDDEQPLPAGVIDYKLRLPSAVTQDTFGRVYLLDAKHARLLALDDQGRLLWAKRLQVGGLELSRPQCLTFHIDLLYLADTGNHRILALDLDGNPINVISGVTDPHGIALFGGKMAVAQMREKTVRIIEIN